MVHSVNGQPLWSYALTHTALGQLSSQTGTGAQANQSETETVTYDARGRVSGDTDHYQTSSTSVTDSANTYTWDLSNNLQGGVSGWSYNSSNQATSAAYSSAAPSLSGASGLSYDASGNLTATSGTPLTWDCWGHLSGTTGAGSAAVSFTYDSAGRRVSKTVGSVTTYFLYAGGALTAELDSSGNLTRSYDWGPTGLIGDTSASGSRYYLYDGMGSTRFLLNAAGQVVSDAAYTAWGSINSPAAIATPFAWKGQSGQYTDSETSLVYCNARYYSPAIGRFLSRDPIAFAGGINVYGYCGGDPVNYADPSGLSGESLLLGAEAATEVVAPYAAQTATATATVGETAAATLGTTAATAGTSAGLAATVPVAATILPGAILVGEIGVLGYCVWEHQHSIDEATRCAQPINIASLPHRVRRVQSQAYQGNRGMLGGPTTEAQENSIATGLEHEGWTITHGAGRGSQECLFDPAQPTSGVGRPKNTVFPDITAVRSGRTIRVQTVDVLSNGDLTPRERNNAIKIMQRRPNDGLFLIPKLR